MEEHMEACKGEGQSTKQASSGNGEVGGEVNVQYGEYGNETFEYKLPNTIRVAVIEDPQFDSTWQLKHLRQ